MSERPEHRGDLSNNREQEARVSVELTEAELQDVLDGIHHLTDLIETTCKEYNSAEELDGLKGLQELQKKKESLELLSTRLLAQFPR